jgi:uncharacterized protein YdhG (YjbR/CyaY superfamily)
MRGGQTGVANSFDSVDDYIASFPATTRAVLHDIRRAMHAAVPGAGETISYDIPTITLDGRAVVYFAGWQRHVSVYPVPAGSAEYEQRVAPYRSGASTAKFPLSEPVPYELVGEIAALLATSAAG